MKLIDFDVLKKLVEQRFDMQDLYLPTHFLEIAEELAEPLSEVPLILYLALYAPAPMNAPDDWFHHAEENWKAWKAFINTCEQGGCYPIPIEEEEK